MSFSREQSAVSPLGSGQQTATFGSTPVEGNLLIAYSFHRFTGTSAVITGSGWTQRFLRTTSLGDSGERRGEICFTKVAGAAEPQAVGITWSPSSEHEVMVQEIEDSEGGDWTFEDAADNASNTSPYSTGTTGVIPAGDQLIMTLAGWRVVSTDNPTSVAWTNGLGDLLEFNSPDSDGIKLASAFDEQSVSETKDSVLSWVLSDNESSQGILAFTALAVVAPTVDAGGPYNGPSGVATALDATVTPGSDPTPVLLWTIDSGGTGLFSNDAIEDPTFTPTFPTVGPYTLRLTVTPSDGPAVFDTADFESDAVAPSVDAGGPYNGDQGAPVALDATVVPGTDPTPTLLWTIDSGGTGTFLPSDSVEDPTFTADDASVYTLRLTATPSDGPAVFGTATFVSDPVVINPQFLAGSLLGASGSISAVQLSIGADPAPGEVIYIKGTAHNNSGQMYVAVDDNAVSRVHIRGIAHQHNGVRLVSFDSPVVNLDGWGLTALGAWCVSASGGTRHHEGILLSDVGIVQMFGVIPPLVPPLLSDLLHWFDFADAAVLWQDAAGTIPIVAGQDVIRVDNKGTDGTPLIEAFPPGGIWTLGLVNGLAGLVNNTNFSASQQSGWLGAGAATTMFFSWGRRTDNLINSSTGVMWQQSGGGGDDQLRGDSAVFSPGDWAVAVAGIPTPTSTTRAIVNNQWNWVYGGADNVGTITYRASGSAKQTMAGVYGAPGPPSTMSWGLPRGEQIEVLVYGRGLTAAEQSLVTAYFDARAGAVLPF